LEAALEAAVDLFSYSQASLAYLQQALTWLLADILIPVNLVQVPAVALSGGIAWLMARPLRHWICSWIEREAGERPGGWLARYRDWIFAELVPLVTPGLWATGLWVAIEVAQRLSWPHDVARIAANLLVAWLVIRLVADLVPSRALARLIAIAAWSLAALNILQLLAPLAEFLDSAAVTLGRLRLSALTVIKGVLALAVMLWVATVASRLFEERITQVADLTPRAQVLFGKLLKISLISLAFVVALTSVGIDLSTLAIFTGAVGVGIGLGLQKTVSNLFSGIILLLDRSIKPGDVIEVGGTYGWVTFLGARYIAVETRDGTEYLIPNEHIVTNQVLNWSHKSERVRLKLGVRAPVDVDVEQVLALMKEAASRPARVLKHPAPNPLIMAFGEGAIDLELRFWIADAHNGVHNIKGEVLLELWRLFREHGVPMPRPKQDVFLHPVSPSSHDAGEQNVPVSGPFVGKRLGSVS
jgi:small-conductance mechanosensitive channel